MVDHVVPNIRPSEFRRHVSFGSEELADDLVRQALLELPELDRDVDRRLGARLEIVEHGHRLAEHDRRVFEQLSGSIPDGPLEVAVLEM